MPGAADVESEASAAREPSSDSDESEASGAGPTAFKHSVAEALRARGRAWHIGVAVVALALLGVAAVAATRSRGSHRLVQSDAEAPIERKSVEAAPGSRCGSVEHDVDYRGVEVSRSDAPSPEACCTRCQNDARCRAWTWAEADLGGGLAGWCTLKTVDPYQELVRVPEFGVVSGLPFQWNRPQSLFCFALILPFSYEQNLLKMQHTARTHVFACDEYAVLSNQKIEVVPGFNTSVVDSDLKCQVGGEFKTALNTDIFLAVWKKIYSDGRFKYNDWTVKVDADCVFFPQRLRLVVEFHKDTYNGVYLNNCKFGMHGPLEVFSRLAVEAWYRGHEQCVQHFTALCSGPCQWGEDMFIDQCMMRVLNVKRINDWNLLSESHCDSDDWGDCRNGRVAFHPFKSIDLYKQCMVNANYGALPNFV